MHFVHATYLFKQNTACNATKYIYFVEFWRTPLSGGR